MGQIRSVYCLKGSAVFWSSVRDDLDFVIFSTIKEKIPPQRLIRRFELLPMPMYFQVHAKREI